MASTLRNCYHEPFLGSLPQTPAPPVPQEADIVIIGGGVIGLSTAWHLLQSGRQPLVMDPDPGSCASFAAAGMLASISEVQYRQEALVPLMRASARLYPSFVAQVEAASGKNVGWRPTETLVLAFDSADAQHLADLTRYQQELNLMVDPLSTREARRREPVLSPSLAGAAAIAEDHQIDPRLLMKALRYLLDRKVSTVKAVGIAIEEGAVTGVHWRDANGLQGLVKSSQVVVANGLAAQDLKGPDSLASLPLRPVHGDIIRLIVPDRQRPFLNRTIRGIVRGNPVYVVPRNDNTLVLGATSREDDMQGSSAGGIYRLLRDAHELVPSLTELEIYEVTARARPGTPDDIPLLGNITHRNLPLEGAVIASGFFRHGILLAPWAAQLLTRHLNNQLTCQDRNDLVTCHPYRFAQAEKFNLHRSTER